MLPLVNVGFYPSTSTVESGYSKRGEGTMKLPRSERVWGPLPVSEHAKKTVNPIRKIVDVMSIKPNKDKHLIKLHLGDPTLTGSLLADNTVISALEDSATSGKYNGYGPATGLPKVREALADHVTCPEAPVTEDDVILTSGCSHALQMAIEVLANPGDNILVPCPGFPLYGTLMRPHDIEDRQYNLLMEQNWEVDLDHLESLMDERTKAIVVNNPSNPCGAVYSKQHLQAILKLADRYRVPIIADEIYGDLVFGGAEFHPMATLEPKVPMLSCDGISKRYLVPGWRLGWLIIHDRFDGFREVRNGLRQLATKIVGPSAPIQGALPALLQSVPGSFFDNTREVLAENATLVFQELQSIRGLIPVKSQGAMYMMVGVKMSSFPQFKDDLDICKALIAEESLYCLPGTAFGYEGAVRLVLTYPADVMQEACDRLREFCKRHYKQDDMTARRKFSVPSFVMDLFDSDFPIRFVAAQNPHMG